MPKNKGVWDVVKIFSEFIVEQQDVKARLRALLL
jgi:hypothetical protein